MEQPDIEYAKSGDVSIAYQVIGDGPIDVLLVPFLNNLEYAWAHPLWPRVYERLAAFSRVIMFDKRGTGLSDRFSELPTLEVRMDDLRAVLDDIGSERTALLGSMEGNHLAALFAATYPERTSALVLYDPVARFIVGSGLSLGRDRGGVAAACRTGCGELGAASVLRRHAARCRSQARARTRSFAAGMQPTFASPRAPGRPQRSTG